MVILQPLLLEVVVVEAEVIILQAAANIFQDMDRLEKLLGNRVKIKAMQM